MKLCEICNAANSKSFEEGDCYVCGGRLLETDGMIAEASALLERENVSSFSISTVIPKDFLAREEKIWDIRSNGAESVKNYLNRTINSRISRSGMRYDKDGPVRLVIDYQEKKVGIERGEVFVFGRYRKAAAGLSQSRWICSACGGEGCPKCDGKGKMYESVEERIGEPIKAAFEADDYVLHASGREDVDATNSAGRPFVMEVKNPKAREADLDGISRAVGESGEVSVSGLRLVKRKDVELVTESHFDKAYEAEVEFEKDISETDMEKIHGLEGRTILQQTPNRVSHRRADLVRHRKVQHVEVVNAKGKRAMLIIKAEAGTYIKELISGDGGRTKPSVAEALGFSAKCVKLNVSMIDDQYLDFTL